MDALVQAQGREVRTKQLLGKTSPVATPRASGAVRARMEEVLRWLLAARNPGQGTWHYYGEGGHDYSNTQFAVLGLQICLEHKVHVPREVFLEIARQFSQSQLREREEVEFSITYAPGKNLWKAFSNSARVRGT